MDGKSVKNDKNRVFSLKKQRVKFLLYKEKCDRIEKEKRGNNNAKEVNEL